MTAATGDLFGAPPAPTKPAPAPAAVRSSGPTQAAMVSEALRRATAPEPIDIGEADPPAGCYEITSLVDPRRRYMNPNTNARYVGRAVFP